MPIERKISILDVQVSHFPGAKIGQAGNLIFDPKPTGKVSLLRFLKPRTEAVQRVLAVRECADATEQKRLKMQLPAVTPSGIFSYRKAENLLAHSGLVCLDIDFKDNEHILNFADLKTEISKLPFVAYCGLSVRGNGWFVLVPIAEPTRHGQHFAALVRLFEGFQIVVDTSGSDVCRPRFLSYDPDGYFNHAATQYRNILETPVRPAAPKAPFPVSATRRSVAAMPGGVLGDETKVLRCLAQIEARQLDLTANYETWVRLGFAFASAFGERGRDFFHRASRFYPLYDWQEADRQFTACLKSNKPGGCQLPTFYAICKEHGVSFLDTNDR